MGSAWLTGLIAFGMPSADGLFLAALAPLAAQSSIDDLVSASYGQRIRGHRLGDDGAGPSVGTGADFESATKVELLPTKAPSPIWVGSCAHRVIAGMVPAPILERAPMNESPR